MISDYEELCKYNETSNGWIYLMRHKTKGYLAVKKILSANCYEVYSRLFNIHHAAITRVYEVELFNEQCIVIEEFINGTLLMDRIAVGKLFSPAEARDIAISLCEAVSVLAENNIVHRDITATNIMLTSDNKVKLFDFNISRIYRGESKQDTRFLGTDGYAPPEQFGFGQTDVRSDIYSIGILLNEMLTGYDLKNGIYSVHGQLRHVITKATQLDMNNRYEKVEYMLEDLNSAYKAKRYGLDRVFRQIPGFRTLKLWKMVLAVMGYFLLITSMITHIYNAIEEPATAFSLIMYIITTCMIPYCFFLNPGEIRSRLFGIEKNQRWFAFFLGVSSIEIGLIWGAFL